jgi:hypothetical protein
VRELSVQTRGRKLLLLAGAFPVKVGYDGWPDYIVLIGDNRHFWIEWKAPGGKLRPNQVKRIEQLRKGGELVYVLDEAGEALAALAEARRTVRLPAGFHRADQDG